MLDCPLFNAGPDSAAMQTLSVILASIGAVFIIVSFKPASKTWKNVPPEFRSHWRVIRYLMYFFIVGYVFFGVVVLSGFSFPDELITGGVFLGGAIFVFIIIHLTHNTIVRITEVETSLKTIFESANDLILNAGLNGGILYVNRAWREALGYAEQESAGLSIFDMVDAGYRARFENTYKEVLSGRDVPVETVMFRAKDGRRIYLEGNINCQFKEGRPVSALGIFRDITKRKLTERSLEHQLNFLQTLIDTIPSPVFYKDIEGRYLGCNVAFEAMLGKSRGDIIDKTVYDVSPRELAEKYRETDSALFQNPGVQQYEASVQYADGSLHDVLFNKATFTDRSGSIAGLVGVMLDITERKRIEESIQAQKRFTESLIENSAVATFVLDSEHKVLIWNKACEELAGVPASEIIGTDDQWKPFYDHKRSCLADVVIDGDMQKLPELYSVYAKSSLAVNGLHAEGWFFNMRGKDRYLLFDAAPIYNSAGAVVAAIETIQDITERKKFEEQLLHAQKLEAVGQLAGGIAHDFNNFLTVISGYAVMLQKSLVHQDPLRLYADEIVSAAKRAANLTTSLLTINRKDIINPSSVNLNENVKRVGKLLSRLIGEHIEFKISLSREDLIVTADSGQLEQVLINLATNARDAMPEGGALVIETALIDIDEEFANRHLLTKQGKYARMTVTDTGIGMDAAIMERIFEPFFTTKDLGRGTGLGLSIAYGIIKQHNGNITVYSEPGWGTTFKIYLPVIELLNREGPPEELPEPEGGTETILLAEDDQYVRELSKTILEDAGYTVLEAADGEEAIKLFTENQESIQIALLDVIMPRKHGKDVHNWIKRVSPETKVLFMSGYEADLVFRRGILEEGLNLLTKPASSEELLRKVREVLDGR